MIKDISALEDSELSEMNDLDKEIDKISEFCGYTALDFIEEESELKKQMKVL